MIKIINCSVVDMEVDCIVNAANSALAGGGGVDGAIHDAAGFELYVACAKIGHCNVGEAVITPGFNLRASYIIHTVGPIYGYYENKECERLLRNCYLNSLDLAKTNNIHSIAFPGISTGIYGYPINEAIPIAIDTVKQWLYGNSDYNLDVWFCCYTKREYEEYLNNDLHMINEQLYREISDYIDTNYEEEIEFKEKCFNIFPEREVVTLGNIECDNYSFEPEETFSQRLLKIIDEKNFKDSDVYNKANIDRRLFSKIRSNIDYSPSKQTVLAFCIALNLNIEDAEDLLERAGFALSYSNRTDLIIRYFIEEKENYTLYDVDEALMSFNQKPISKY